MLCELAQQYKKLSGSSKSRSHLLCHNFIKYVAPNIMVLIICSLLFLLQIPESLAAPNLQEFDTQIRHPQQEQAQIQIPTSAATEPQAQTASQTSASVQAQNQTKGSAIQPQGFDSRSNKRASPRGFGIDNTPSPNTIKGVLHNSRSDDYVVLEGKFVLQQQGNKSFYQFADAAGDYINVDIAKSNNASAPLPDIKYYLWGTIQRDWFSTTINVIEFTPKG